LTARQPPHGRIAILANPLSGRDVRRLASRASTMTHEAKRDLVARVAAGADAAGAREMLVMREPFRIATGALELMPLTARVRVVDVGPGTRAADSSAFVEAARAAGCDVIVCLGGDGTSRLVAKAWPGAPLIPLSTGTNNVFPLLTEATGAGLAAGLLAAGAIDVAGVARPAKLMHVDLPGGHDVALVDVALLAGDHTGNALPVDAAKLRRLVLTRADPAAVGLASIGGMLEPVTANDDCGLWLDCGRGTHAVDAPIAPGLFRRVRVDTPHRLRCGDVVALAGPGVIALDGDREHMLSDTDRASVRLARDGPLVVDVAAALALAARRGLFRRLHVE
jgi:hypothetical protein